MEEKDPRWSNSIRYIALVAMAALLIFALYIARSSLNLVLIAMLIAYLLSPIVRFFQKRLHFKRGLAVAVAYIILLILVIVAISFILPWISEKVQAFFMLDWPMLIGRIDGWLDTWIKELEVNQFTVGGFEIDLATPLIEFRQQINSINAKSINIQDMVPNISSILQNAVMISTDMIGRVVTVLLMGLTATMASIHFSKDGYKLGGFIVNLFEEKYRPELRELLHRLGEIWHNYFAGELKLMLFIGLLSCAVFGALGLKWALLLGIIAGFCEVVPNIGPILACVPAAISALVFGSSWLDVNNILLLLIVVVACIVIQQLENIIIVPRIMGDALDLHPVVIILGILILSSRLGIFGALLASPLIGLSKEVLSFVVKKIKQEPPYPEIYMEE